MARRDKFRADFRKNRAARVRQSDLTRRFQTDDTATDDVPRNERISGKGELTRRRTVRGDLLAGEAEAAGPPDAECLRGRVLAVRGLLSDVETDEGRVYSCATRRLLKTLATDERHVVAAGDLVWFRPANDREGLIERVLPRRGVLSRSVRGRRHLVVSHVDQVIVVGSAAEPHLKPNLIDRFLVVCEQNGLRPVICVNKVDLVEPARLLPLAGVFGRMGYEVLFTSATTGQGIERLRRLVAGRQSVFTGQSGVGKSSLLNAIEPDLGLRVAAVSRENEKGRHTTTTAQLIRLAGGGHVVDTPGIRQFELWDVAPAEVASGYRDLRSLVSLCRFPNCTHTHEEGCAVKDAVADGWLDTRRYDSYCLLFTGDRAAARALAE